MVLDAIVVEYNIVLRRARIMEGLEHLNLSILSHDPSLPLECFAVHPLLTYVTGSYCNVLLSGRLLTSTEKRPYSEVFRLSSMHSGSRCCCESTRSSFD